MTVLEMQTQARPATRWTEVCATDHPAPTGRPARQARQVTAPHRRPMRRSSGRVAEPAVTGPARPAVRGPRTGSTPVAPGRRVLVRPASSERVRACRVEAPSVSGVVDDVPTWALLACGIAFGIIMLLALAYLGGPAYA